MSDALDFLKRWRSTGPWVLVAIHPESRAIEARTFGLGDEEDMEEWLAGHDGERNLYFHVNPVMRALSKKASRDDIASMDWLHVDIDPRPGKDIEEERERALASLRDPPGNLPLPTVIVFSGGGYQAFWKLTDPFPIAGDSAKYEEAKQYNVQIELALGGDNCHNIDRIMRLPGTMNVPDAKKRAKGREPVRSYVVEFNDYSYDLATEFTPAVTRQSSVDESRRSVADTISTSNVARLASVDELPGTVSETVRAVIVQGRDPVNPDRFPSRSEWLFFVVCNLVRAEVSDDVIYSVITDPDFQISQSVLDKGSRAEKYALHQIVRAHEQVDSPELRELNDRFAVIGNIGGSCRIIEEVADPMFNGRSRVSKQTFTDFRNRYLHRRVQVGTNKDGEPVYKSLGNWWTMHENRRQFDTLVFSPGRDVAGAYNLWQGFACDARPGDCSLLLGHLYENVCSGVDEHYNYILGWMAMAVQHPAKPGETAIVLRGRQGTGKSFFVKQFGSLWGRHFLQVSDAKHLVGNFNAHLRDCVMLFGDEAFYAGDKKHESVLKMLVTEETIVYEMKGVDSEAGPNFTHIFLASNSTWVVPAGAEERRYFVLDVSDSHMQDSKYFAAIAQQMDNGGREALLHMLLTYPLEGFNVRSVPKTDALTDQKMHSMGPEEEWWYGKLCDGVIFTRDEEWPEWVSRDDLFGDYVGHMQKIGRNFRASPTVLGRFLRRVMPAGSLRRGMKMITTTAPWGGEETTSPRPVYFLPSLEQCRSYWEERFGTWGEW